MWLKLEFNTYYLYHSISPRLRPFLGGKTKWIKSTQTSDLAVAELMLAHYRRGMKLMQLGARRALADGLAPGRVRIVPGGYRLRPSKTGGFETLGGINIDPSDDAPAVGDNEAPDSRDDVEDRVFALLSELDELKEVQGDDPEWKDIPPPINLRFNAEPRLADHIDAFISTVNNRPRVLAQKRGYLTRFCDEFPTESTVTRARVTKALEQKLETLSVASIRYWLITLRAFWAYLQRHEIVSEDNNHLQNAKFKARDAKTKSVIKIGFEPAECVTLLNSMLPEDTAVSDHFRIAMLTGARLNEIGCFRLRRNDGSPSIRWEENKLWIPGTKNLSAPRWCPLHPDLIPTLHRLVDDRDNGWLFEGLTNNPNQTERRSTLVGMRFGRVKTKGGFDERYSFHSTRHTVVNSMLRAGVSDWVIGHIVGHKQKSSNVTLSVYGGAPTEQMKYDAILKLRYPGYVPF